MPHAATQTGHTVPCGQCIQRAGQPSKRVEAFLTEPCLQQHSSPATPSPSRRITPAPGCTNDGRPRPFPTPRATATQPGRRRAHQQRHTWNSRTPAGSGRTSAAPCAARSMQSTVAQPPARECPRRPCTPRAAPEATATPCYRRPAAAPRQRCRREVAGASGGGPSTPRPGGPAGGPSGSSAGQRAVGTPSATMHAGLQAV